MALKSQTLFWAETFGVGTTCGANQGTLANGFVTPNGSWGTTQTGVNDAFANVWYVSQTEGGNRALGSCGKGCLDSAGLIDRTLHISNVPGSPFSALCPTGDCGAKYDPGVGNNRVRTHTRIESPVISCVGKAGINLQFDAIINGRAGDSLTLWYFDGAVWNVVGVPPVTATCSPSPNDTEGVWATYAYVLPATADNNGAIRIGYEWVNNDDGASSNPSAAIDNIKMLANTLGSGPSTLTITIVPYDTVSTVPLYCTNIPYHFTGRANPGPILFYNWESYSSVPGSNATFNPNPPYQNGVDVTFPVTGTYTLVMTANSQFNGIDSNQIIVYVQQTPTVNVTPLNPTVCLNGTGTVLYATGASTYTWTSTTPVLPPTYLDANGDSVNVNPVPTPSNVVTYTVVGTASLVPTYTAGCVSLPTPITVTITPPPTPHYSITPDTICNGSHAILAVTGMPITTTYTWSATNINGGVGTNSGSSAQVTPHYTGVVDTTFSYTSSLAVPGCPAYLPHTLNVVVRPTPTVTPVSDTADNCNHMGAILSVTSTPVSASTTYSWSPSIHLSSTTGSTVTATPTVATKYYVTSTLNGCTSNKDSVMVLIGDTTYASISSEYQIICSGQKNQFIAYPQNNLLNNTYTYSWQPQPLVSSSIGGDTVVVQPTISPGTIYTLTVHGTCVKHNVATYEITVNNCTMPNVSFSANTHTICVHHCITFKDSTQYTSTKPLFYSWVFVGGSISPVPGSTVDVDTLFYEMTDTLPLKPVKVCYQVNSLLNANGYYPVIETVTNGIGQTRTFIDSVRVDPGPTANAGPNQTINEGTPTTITGAASSGYAQITTYHWTQSDSSAMSCTTCLNPVVTPTTTTQYTLTITDNNGCQSTDSMTIYVDVVCKDVFIATAFSPNGDGMNDILHVKSNCGMTNMSFKVFDRWGEKVFESTDPDYGWDGTYKNKAMNSDVFMYTLDGYLSSGVEVKKKGNVTLMR